MHIWRAVVHYRKYEVRAACGDPRPVTNALHSLVSKVHYLTCGTWALRVGALQYPTPKHIRSLRGSPRARGELRGVEPIAACLTVTAMKTRGVITW